MAVEEKWRFFLFLFFIPASRMSLPHYQIWDFPHQAGSRAVFYRPSIEGKERGYIHVRFEGPGGDAHLLHASGILTACTTARLHSVSFHERRGFSQVFFFLERRGSSQVFFVFPCPEYRTPGVGISLLVGWLLAPDTNFLAHLPIRLLPCLRPTQLRRCEGMFF